MIYSDKPDNQRSRSDTRRSHRIAVGWGASQQFSVPIPKNENERLEVLQSYCALDTPPEAEFDNITSLAATICNAPIALISLVDSDRQWFKSKVGISANETARDIAFCAYAIMESGLFVVRDALADERFAYNPLVTVEPKIRFYAGAPLITADHYALGTLCVMDYVPRELSPEQATALLTLGRQVVAILELKRQVSTLIRTLSDLKKE